MPDTTHFCVLVAEIIGGNHLVARLGEQETARALERCLNRVDLSIGGNSGEIIARDNTAIIATFRQCDDGVMAACEAIDRVHKLPPASGVRMQLRMGLHYGKAKNGVGEGVDGARMVLLSCDADQALVSAPVVDRLMPAVRKFIGAEPFCDDSIGELPWPIFTVFDLSVTSSNIPMPRPEPSSPLTSLKPQSIPVSPLASSDTRSSSPVPCMRLKHQKNTLFLDGSRPVVLLGRELGNDIVIIDPRASRQHARIERRRKGFVLIDESTNGCFVAIDGQQEQCVKGAEMPLNGSGRFGCGFSPENIEDDIVIFELV